MPPVRPYQPSLLRLLHGAMVLLAPLAWLTRSERQQQGRTLPRAQASKGDGASGD